MSDRVAELKRDAIIKLMLRKQNTPAVPFVKPDRVVSKGHVKGLTTGMKGR